MTTEKFKHWNQMRTAMTILILAIMNRMHMRHIWNMKRQWQYGTTLSCQVIWKTSTRTSLQGHNNGIGSGNLEENEGISSGETLNIQVIDVQMVRHVAV
jgi:hypothetical protein